MYVIGLDIGYSNLKVVSGEAGKTPNTSILPAAAAPVDQVADLILGNAPADKNTIVNVNDEPWVAGVSPRKIEGYVREVHHDYPSSGTYQALMLAGLRTAEVDRVDHLVTGLPVSHFQDEEKREALKAKIEGVHRIDEERSVEVLKASVIPQPVGSFMSIVSDFDDAELLEEGRVLVIDPGFFSVDWLTIEGMEARMASSGTSLKAMSKLLEKAASIIEEAHGPGLPPEAIEAALRDGKERVFHYGERVKIAEPLAAAAASNAKTALTALSSSMREDASSIDVVILCGGGARLYEEAARSVFDRSRIVVPESPVLSNARGFFFYGL